MCIYMYFVITFRIKPHTSCKSNVSILSLYNTYTFCRIVNQMKLAFKICHFGETIICTVSKISMLNSYPFKRQLNLALKLCNFLEKIILEL